MKQQVWIYPDRHLIFTVPSQIVIKTYDGHTGEYETIEGTLTAVMFAKSNVQLTIEKNTE